MSELWENPLLTLEDRLEIAIGAIKFRDAQLAATKQKLESAEAEARFNKSQALEVCEQRDNYQKRAETAESRIKASQEQEPVMWYEADESARGECVADVINSMAYSTRIHIAKPDTTNPAWGLYAQPIIPPTEAELLQRIAELEKQMKEGK